MPTPDEPEWFPTLYRKLLIADIQSQLPDREHNVATLPTEDDARRLIGWASVLSLSTEPRDRGTAYEVVTRLLPLFSSRIGSVVSAADIILSRLGNFPGRSLLRSRYTDETGTAPSAPARLRLERLGREIENTVTDADAHPVTLTDFQRALLEALASSPSVSVSAPTSAGKSFVFGIDIVRRLRKTGSLCIVYVVPTRALIREVTLSIRAHLRQVGMEHVPVRSVPFPIPRDKAPHGAVFVLTQERLLSLLHSRDGVQPISTLVVDEAQNICDSARGVTLQTAIESALARNPHSETYFASPLSSNPEFLLALSRTPTSGTSLTDTLSPVSQNLILVSEVHRQPRVARFTLLGANTSVDLGVHPLGFSFRGSSHTQRASLARAITQEDESTLLYCNRPSDAEQLALALVASAPAPLTIDAEISELIDFITTEVHPQYSLIDCLPHGVAYHYGFMPAIVRSRVEDLCRGGKLRFVCCTSTLLQGVNLPARHIIIENPKRGPDEGMSRADFLNLAGRAGRLLREFHGNVWCLRPGAWQAPSFDGPPLTAIHSAMDDAMADGGTIIQKVLSNNVAGLDTDYGEATLGKLYCDFVRGNRDLATSQWRTPHNAESLAATAQALAALQISLPTAVLDANQSVRPDRMQTLYDRLKQIDDLTRWIPLHPGLPGANDRMGDIIQLLQETLGGVNNNSHSFYKWLAIRWIYDTPLSHIISAHVSYNRKHDSDKTLSTLIRELLSTLEEAIRFRLVKYYMAYSSILEHILQERGDTVTAESLEPFHIYLECGASDRVTLNLMATGLSRATALALRAHVQFPDDASPEDCLGKLAGINLNTLAIPSLCHREIRDLLGQE